MTERNFLSAVVLSIFLCLAFGTAEPTSIPAYCEQAPGKGQVYDQDEFFTQCIAWCMEAGYELAPGDESEQLDTCTYDCCPMPALVL